MKQSGEHVLPRRRFLQQLIILGGATGASVIALQNPVSEINHESADNPPADNATPSRGYRLTPHIRSYYEKAQI